MNRNFVQKTIVVISNLPFYGVIASRIQPTTQIYFEQKNFENTSIISEAYDSLQISLKSCDVSDLSLGFSTRMLLHKFKEKIMMLWKLILLQGRILVFSKKPSQVSCFIYALISLYPGQLCFNDFSFCEDYKNHLSMYGLPLSIFNEDYAFSPYFSIFQLSELEKAGYLIGCTNQMIIEHPTSSPHAVVNLETNVIKFTLPSRISRCIKLNSHESKFIKELCKVKYR